MLVCTFSSFVEAYLAGLVTPFLLLLFVVVIKEH